MLAELLALIVEVVARFQLFLPVICEIRHQDRPRHIIFGHDIPSVDVFVLAWGGYAAIVMDTIAAAIAQEHHPDRLQFFCPSCRR